MKLQEAYDILGIPQASSEEEAKKAFKSKAKILHPDNKETGNEEEFKKINAAFDRIRDGREDNPSFPGNGFGFGGFGISIEDLIGGFGGIGRQTQRRQPIPAPDIHLTETISFRDSVLGCQKTIKFNRNNKCNDCDGAGQKALDNGCIRCGGKGTITSRQANFITQSTCPQCKGQIASQSCSNCSGTGILAGEASIAVRMPAGITADKNVLKIGRCGNFAGSSMMGEQYSQVSLTVNITPQDGLSLQGNDVITSISIPLLDALQGCVRSVPTIDGNRDAIIPEGTRNKEEVVMPNLGVNRSGNQRVIVSVDYPADTKTLIDFLKPPINTIDTGAI